MLNKIIRKLNTKDGKALLENFVSLSALQAVGLILPLVVLPYVIRVLGFERYGIVVLGATLIAYFQSITDYSFRVTATRDVAIFRNSVKKLNIVYSKVIAIKTIFLIISVIIIVLIVFFYSPFYKEKIIFFLTIPMLLGYALFPEWFFQGIERMKYITFLNVGIRIFFTVCIFIFIKSKDDYWIYPLLQSLGYIGAGVVGQYIMMKKYNIRFVRLKWRTIKTTITSNFPIFVNRFVPTLYNNTSTFLLGIFTGTNLVGVYDAIKKIVDLAIVFFNLFSRVFFPFLNRRKDAFGKYKKMMILISCSVFVVIVLLNKVILKYLNIEWKEGFIILLILAIGMIGIALYDLFGMNYFIVHRMDKLVMRNAIWASCIGFVLSFPLIYYYGIIGAAINLSLSRWLMGGGLYYKYLTIKSKQLV